MSRYALNGFGEAVEWPPHLAQPGFQVVFIDFPSQTSSERRVPLVCDLRKGRGARRHEDRTAPVLELLLTLVVHLQEGLRRHLLADIGSETIRDPGRTMKKRETMKQPDKIDGKTHEKH